MKAGRLGEAQQVLAMLKEQELYNYTERSAEGDARTTIASLTPAEQQLEARSDQWISLGKEYAQLQAALLLPRASLQEHTGLCPPACSCVRTSMPPRRATITQAALIGKQGVAMHSAANRGLRSRFPGHA